MQHAVAAQLLQSHLLAHRTDSKGAGAWTGRYAGLFKVSGKADEAIGLRGHPTVKDNEVGLQEMQGSERQCSNQELIVFQPVSLRDSHQSASKSAHSRYSWS